MENGAYLVLMFTLGAGLAFVLYFFWKKFEKKATGGCGCGKTATA